jgi:trehalose 6-phosphate phosphatase
MEPLGSPFVPDTSKGREGLAALLGDPAHALVGVDFDGTLAPIVKDPAQAWAHPGAAKALEAVASRYGTVAIITGRPAAVASELAGLRAGGPFGERLLVLGHYGFERWDGRTGELHTPPPSPGVARARGELTDLLAAVGAPAGTAIEDKELSLAVHVRQTAEPDTAFAQLHPALSRLAADCGLHLEPGRFVLELRPHGMDKGTALRALVTERGAQSVLFAGDDLGDIAAFDAIETLRDSGVPGICVWSASQEVAALADRTDLTVNGPEGVVELLQALASD